MNKFERHSPAGKQILPETAAGDLSPTTAEVLDVSDAPATLLRPPLTPSEVRTILMSLMLTMFLAALDQTISRRRCRRSVGNSTTFPTCPG